MNDVRLPIETTREGDKITKVCVEDTYKVVNRVKESLSKNMTKIEDILENFVKKEYVNSQGKSCKGYLIIGNGVSQPCNDDVFDEELGNEIAFRKAKLNANIKKHHFLVRIYNHLVDIQNDLNEDIFKIEDNICYDLNELRNYNEDYLSGLEDILGIENPVLEEDFEEND